MKQRNKRPQVTTAVIRIRIIWMRIRILDPKIEKRLGYFIIIMAIPYFDTTRELSLGRLTELFIN